MYTNFSGISGDFDYCAAEIQREKNYNINLVYLKEIFAKCENVPNYLLEDNLEHFRYWFEYKIPKYIWKNVLKNIDLLDLYSEIRKESDLNECKLIKFQILFELIRKDKEGLKNYLFNLCEENSLFNMYVGKFAEDKISKDDFNLILSYIGDYFRLPALTTYGCYNGREVDEFLWDNLLNSEWESGPVKYLFK